MARVTSGNVLKATALAAVFLLLAVAVVYPALSFMSWWGVHDWVQFYTYYGVPYRAVAEFHELPGWNPYFYGGNVQWGHPDDPTLSPLFVPILLFGVVAGVKIDIVLVLAGGMVSMWLLARRLGLSPAAAFFASAVWGLNGWHAYHFAVGHCDHLTFLFEPLVAYFFLRALDDLRWGIGAAAVLAFMYFSGGPYPLMFSIILLLAMGLLFSGHRNSPRPMRAVVTIFIFGAGFMAVKMMSTLVFMLFAEPVASDMSGTGLTVLWRALFNPSLRMFTKYGGTQWGSWEYAAFIGYIPALAFLAGAVAAARRAWPWVAMAAIFVVTSFGNASPVDFFSLFTALPGLSGMHVPFRFIAHVILAVAVVGGMGLDAVGGFLCRIRLKRAAPGVLWLTAAAATANLVWMHYDRPVPLYRLVSYLVPPRKYGGRMPQIPPFRKLEKSEEAYVPITYDQALQVYVYFLNGKRLSWGYDATRLPNMAKFPGDADYRAEVYLLRGEGGSATLTGQTLSTYRVEYQSDQDNTVVLNQNFAPGWRTSASGKAYERGGLVAVDVPAGEGTVEFKYVPACRTPGLVVTILSIVAAVFFARRPRTPPPTPAKDARAETQGPAGAPAGAGRTGPA